MDALDQLSTEGAVPSSWPIEPPQLMVPAMGGPRYRIDGFLGAGTTGEVWAVEDLQLGRIVAMKVLTADGANLPEECQAFLAEARTGSALRHPNTLPVHDVGHTTDGRPWFTMPRVEGRSLAQVLDASRLAKRDPLVPDVAAVVRVAIGACQALAHAHHQGVVHQDVKPGNILLGDFGEVLLVDWGSSVRRGADGRWVGDIVGTPLYMSPEQARREGVDPRCDVYALGGTLLHALLLRQPVIETDEARFWAKKRAGQLTLPTEAERYTLSRPLLAIALKALDQDPQRRYQDAEELRRDLLAWQAGEAVAAWAEPWWMRAWRATSRQSRVIAPVAAAVLLALSIAAVLWNERAKERSTWGPPIISEDFTAPEAITEWLSGGGSFRPTPAGLTSQARERSLLVFNRRLSGSTAIDLEVLSDGPPGELAVGWLATTTLAQQQSRVAATAGGWWLRLGGDDDPAAGIRSHDDGSWLAVLTQGVVKGRQSHVRIEVSNTSIVLNIDGRSCTYVAPFPISGGWLALAGERPGKSFTRIRVANLGPPQRLPATAIGDHLVAEGRWWAAIDEYARIAAAHAGTELAIDAAWREGLCLLKVDRPDAAFATFAQLGGGRWTVPVELHRLDLAFARNDHTAVLNGLLALNGKPEAAVRWSGWMRALLGNPRGRELLPGYLTVGRQAFPGDPAAELAESNALLALGRGREVAAMLTGHAAAARGLLQTGDFALVVDGHANAPEPWGIACLALAETERLRSGELGLPDERDRAHIQIGKGAAIAEDPQCPPAVRAEALCSLGRYQDALVVDPRNDLVRILAGRSAEVEDPDWRPIALLEQGRLPDALAAAQVVEDTATRWDQPGLAAWPGYALALDFWQRGDRTQAIARLAVPPRAWLRRDDVAFAHLVLPVVLASITGEQAQRDQVINQLRKDQPRLGGGLWLHLANVMAGGDPTIVGTVPRLPGLTGWKVLATALAGERSGERFATGAAYRTWLKLTPAERGGEPLPVTRRFVVMRLATLESVTTKR